MSQRTLDPETAPEPVGRRERKKNATWLALHDAAMTLSVEKGFERLTVEEICDRADVSVRTFFNYFACKEDAVLGGQQGFDDVVEQVRARPADEPPFESIRAVYLLRMQDLGDRAEWIRTRQQLIAESPALHVRELGRMADFETTLAGVVADRIGVPLDTDPYPRLVAAVAMSVLRTGFRAWQAGSSESLPALVDRGFATVAAGLPAPKT